MPFLEPHGSIEDEAHQSCSFRYRDFAVVEETQKVFSGRTLSYRYFYTSDSRGCLIISNNSAV